MTHLTNQYHINYQELFEQIRMDFPTSVWSSLIRVVDSLWIDHYEKMIHGRANIYQFEADPGFITLFDIASERENSINSTGYKETEDRVVAVSGCSQIPIHKRDINRQRGFLGPTHKVFPDGYDKGHYIAHSMGGGMDVNLFPQNKRLNRGWSEAGKRYCSMEKYCAKHTGTGFFIRPLYSDTTWKPAMLEVGVLKKSGDLWIDQFDN